MSLSKNKPNRDKKIAELWLDIVDIVGPAHRWPKSVREMFWTRGLTHKQRPLIAAFVYINGLNPEVCV